MRFLLTAYFYNNQTHDHVRMHTAQHLQSLLTMGSFESDLIFSIFELPNGQFSIKLIFSIFEQTNGQFSIKLIFSIFEQPNGLFSIKLIFPIFVQPNGQFFSLHVSRSDKVKNINCDVNLFTLLYDEIRWTTRADSPHIFYGQYKIL